MTRLVDRLRGETRSITTIDDYIAAVNQYSLTPQLQQTLGGGTVEPVGNSFSAYAGHGHASNSIIFSCMAVRQLVFSSVRFRFQRLRDGKPSDMFGTQALALLERPGVGVTTQDYLLRLLAYADLAGNGYSVLDTPLTRLGGDDTTKNLIMLRPDWMEIIATPRVRRGFGKLGLQRVGYLYTEGGPHSGEDPVPLLRDEVMHFAPMPDPRANFRGMSWLTPVVRELENDMLMTRHKRRYFENGATPNMIVKHPVGANQTKVLEFRKRMDEEQRGTDNAYKTLHLYPGADAEVVGSNLEAIDFRRVQGAGETRIAAAAGVPPVIVGLSEGLEAATYSNYSQARRRLADGTMHPLWQNVAGSHEVVVPPPGPDTRLWYDAEDIPFLREDEKDAAEIQSTRAQTIATLVREGYTPESVIAAVESNDFRVLQHTGLYSVQLQPPGSSDPAPDPGTPPQGGTP
jgi:phage portal protein BeeE